MVGPGSRNIAAANGRTATSNTSTTKTLVGAWPLPAERALPIMEKAAREAKQHTSWTEPNAAFDTALREFVTGTLKQRARFTADVQAWARIRLKEPGHVNSLAETLLKLTTPGVPDTSQGDELWDLTWLTPTTGGPLALFHTQRLLGN